MADPHKKSTGLSNASRKDLAGKEHDHTVQKQVDADAAGLAGASSAEVQDALQAEMARAAEDIKAGKGKTPADNPAEPPANGKTSLLGKIGLGGLFNKNKPAATTPDTKNPVKPADATPAKPAAAAPVEEDDDISNLDLGAMAAQLDERDRKAAEEEQRKKQQAIQNRHDNIARLFSDMLGEETDVKLEKGGAVVTLFVPETLVKQDDKLVISAQATHADIVAKLVQTGFDQKEIAAIKHKARKDGHGHDLVRWKPEAEQLQALISQESAGTAKVSDLLALIHSKGHAFERVRLVDTNDDRKLVDVNPDMQVRHLHGSYYLVDFTDPAASRSKVFGGEGSKIVREHAHIVGLYDKQLDVALVKERKPVPIKRRPDSKDETHVMVTLPNGHGDEHKDATKTEPEAPDDPNAIKLVDVGQTGGVSQITHGFKGGANSGQQDPAPTGSNAIELDAGDGTDGMSKIIKPKDVGGLKKITPPGQVVIVQQVVAGTGAGNGNTTSTELPSSKKEIRPGAATPAAVRKKPPVEQVKDKLHQTLGSDAVILHDEKTGMFTVTGPGDDKGFVAKLEGLGLGTPAENNSYQWRNVPESVLDAITPRSAVGPSIKPTYFMWRHNHPEKQIAAWMGIPDKLVIREAGIGSTYNIDGFPPDTRPLHLFTEAIFKRAGRELKREELADAITKIHVAPNTELQFHQDEAFKKLGIEVPSVSPPAH